MTTIQCHRFLSYTTRVIYCLLFYSLALVVVNAEQQGDEDASTTVFRWLQKEHGDSFYFNPKLHLEGDDSIHAHESLEESEILMVIPSSAIISINTLHVAEEEIFLVEDRFCSLAECFWKELLDGETSDFAPYIQYIQQKHASRPTIPNFWSAIGKRLIGYVFGDYLTTDFLIDWIDDFESCREFLIWNEDHGNFDAEVLFQSYGEDYTTIWHSDVENLRRHVVAVTAETQIDQKLFVPLYDQLEHHLVDHNVKHVIKDEYTVVVAQRRILSGETLYRPSQACLFECMEPTQPIVLDIVRNFGYLPNYPHYWEIPSLELAFTIHASSNETMEGSASSRPTLSWIETPHEGWQVESLESEYKRLQRRYKEEVLKSNETVPPHEWKVIEEYSTALQIALGLAIEFGRKEITSPAATEGDKGQQQGEKKGIARGECGVEDKIYESIDVDRMQGAESKGGEDDEQTEWNAWSNRHKKCSNCTLEELAQSRGCDAYSFSTIHNETTWTHLRAAYVAIMRGNSTIKATSTDGSGIRVPFKIGHSPGRGRGVFAMDDVSKGTLVWTSEHTGTFTNGDQFRRFLAVLPDVLVCDLTNWCYTSNGESSNSTGFIECDLDEGSLFNACGDIEEQTLGCNEDLVKDPNLCDENVYALRDIQKGEELLTNYSDFSTASWRDFGL